MIVHLLDALLGSYPGPRERSLIGLPGLGEFLVGLKAEQRSRQDATVQIQGIGPSVPDEAAPTLP